MVNNLVKIQFSSSKKNQIVVPEIFYPEVADLMT